MVVKKTYVLEVAVPGWGWQPFQDGESFDSEEEAQDHLDAEFAYMHEIGERVVLADYRIVEGERDDDEAERKLQAAEARYERDRKE